MWRNKRSIIFPNFGFQRQLLEFEKQLSIQNYFKDSILKDESKEEEKKLEVKNIEPSSYSPYQKHNKLNAYEGKMTIGKATKHHHKPEQVKPTQFHYP